MPFSGLCTAGSLAILRNAKAQRFGMIGSSNGKPPAWHAAKLCFYIICASFQHNDDLQNFYFAIPSFLPNFQLLEKKNIGKLLMLCRGKIEIFLVPIE